MKSESAPLRAQFFRGNRLNFALALGASLLTAGLNLLIARVLQQMIDAVSGVPGAPGLRELALDIGLILVLIAVLKALEYYAKPRFLERAMRQYKDRAFELLTQKSIAAFSGEDSAVYLSAFSNDAASVERGCLDGLFSLASNAVLALGALVMMLAYSPLLTVISCAFFALPIAASLAAGDRVERAECALETLGFRDFRVRFFHGAARLQVTEEQLSLALERRKAIFSALGAAFDGVLLDLKPRGLK